MSNNSIWAGPRLLVPITVNGLVVTQVPNTTKFSIQSLNLKQEFEEFGPLSPRLFTPTTAKTRPDPGVHLNWALPDGMTKGKINKEGKVEYPYLPNRWMITRFSTDPGKRRAWIVKSDEMSETPFPDQKVNPQIIKDNNGVAEVKYIGHWYDFENFNEPGEPAELILTAVGNSDPMFTAYAGNNAFVFSFIDKLSDSNALNVSYMVSGWYSNALYDVLYTKPKVGKEWEDRTGWLATMNKLQWSVGSQAITDNEDLRKAIAAGQRYLGQQGVEPSKDIEGTYAAQTLCHGLLLNVEWPGITHQPSSMVPDARLDKSSVYISAANSATDCLAAFMQWQLNFNNPIKSEVPGDDSEVEIMLEAFANKMLNQPGGVYDTPELHNAIREAWFGKLPGGRIWVAQAIPKNGTPNPNDSKSSLAELPTNRADELAALNRLQADYDSKYRDLISRQKLLYADWLKWNIAKQSLTPPVALPELERVLNISLQKVNELMLPLPAAKKVIEDTSIALRTEIEKAFELKDKPANEFYRPNDPVLLVNNAKRSYKRGEDIVYSEFDDMLFTRFSGQFINSLDVKPGNEVKRVTARDICEPMPAREGIPSEVYALLDEAYLLDTNFALRIATVATGDPKPDPQSEFVKTIMKQQTLVWNKLPDTPIDQRTIEEISGFNASDELFHVPSKIGVTQWEQPWTPLYLEWQVGFVPKIDTDLSNWEFDGRDFNWKKGTPIPDPRPGDKVFQGRSILTPAQAAIMRNRLEEFISTFDGKKIPPDYEPLQDVLDGVGNWDVLSQTLTGFSMQMLQWDLEQFGYQPQDAFAGPVGDEAHGMVLAGYPNNFFPVRAGFVNIKKLWIVDDFGQVYDITADYVPSGKVFNAIPGIGVRPGDYDIKLQLPTSFQLPPRLSQGSRLNFDFISAANDAVRSSQSLLTTPVCGWVLPNHLNHSVMVYDNGGIFIGEVMLMGATGAYHAQWVPAPFDGCHADDISNRHLKGFVRGLLGVARGDEGTQESGKALKNFSQAIDETLWGVDPLGERNNQSLSILVGRPIAVVRAAMGLELYGNASTNLAWERTGQNDTGGVNNYKFPVQIGSLELGQDGVMGYFTNDDYSAFNTVHNAMIVDPASPPYIVNKYTPVQPNAAAVHITLLLDPRGAIHCSTGVLPVLNVELSELYIGKVLDDMLVEFKAGPLLVDKTQWWLPLPAGVGQQWSWLQPYREDDELEWSEVHELVAANAVPQMSASPKTIVEGRLKLTGVLGDQMLLLFLEVVGQKQPYSFPVDTIVQLGWASQGATSATLAIGNADAETVPANESAYAYTVTKTQDITLTISDGKSTQKLTINIAVA